MSTLKTVEIYTDGGCRGNPGPGGWGTLLRFGQHEKELYGFDADTTNNRMEMSAAVAGLEYLSEACHVILTTDSEYLRQGMTSWLKGWKSRGWKNAKKQPVKNQDLWMRLDKACEQHTLDWRWVKGHSGHTENERVDALANLAMDKRQGNHSLS